MPERALAEFLLREPRLGVFAHHMAGMNRCGPHTLTCEVERRVG